MVVEPGTQQIHRRKCTGRWIIGPIDHLRYVGCGIVDNGGCGIAAAVGQDEEVGVDRAVHPSSVKYLPGAHTHRVTFGSMMGLDYVVCP